jgi:hypothetical protein
LTQVCAHTAGKTRFLRYLTLIRMDPWSSNQWILGCELADQISDQELQSFQ